MHKAIILTYNIIYHTSQPPQEMIFFVKLQSSISCSNPDQIIGTLYRIFCAIYKDIEKSITFLEIIDTISTGAVFCYLEYSKDLLSLNTTADTLNALEKQQLINAIVQNETDTHIQQILFLKAFLSLSFKSDYRILVLPTNQINKIQDTIVCDLRFSLQTEFKRQKHAKSV